MASSYPRTKAFERIALGALGLCVGGLFALVAAGWTPPSLLTARGSIAGEAVIASAEEEAADTDTDADAPEAPAPVPQLTDADRRSTHNLHSAFNRIGYDLDAIGEGWGDVPRITLTSFPKDIGRTASEDLRKDVFIRAMLPLILSVNETIRADREHLAVLRSRVRAGQSLAAADQAWLKQLAERYGQPSTRNLTALLRKVDEVPVSLALAQAIEESGWGTSGVTRSGNSLFGHFTFVDGTPRIKTFDSLKDAVEAYVRNLNSHDAYDDFRRTRAALRAKGDVLDGMALASALDGYSDRGNAYVSDLRTIIKANGLGRYDTARLTPGGDPQSAMANFGEADNHQHN